MCKIKSLFTVILCFLAFHNIYSQNTVRFFAGGSISIPEHKYFVNGELTPSVFDENMSPMISPMLGLDYDIPISKKWSLTTGLGFSIMGARNYYVLETEEEFDDELLVEYVRVNPHLKFHWLRIPVLAKFEVSKDFYLIGGYAFHYTTRKNQNIGTVDPVKDDIVSTYSNFQHAMNFGIRKDFKKISFSLVYHRNINRVWDTKDIVPDSRSYLNLHGIQFNVGYLMRD
jgi:hypothetical protein